MSRSRLPVRGFLTSVLVSAALFALLAWFHERPTIQSFSLEPCSGTCRVTVVPECETDPRGIHVVHGAESYRCDPCSPVGIWIEDGSADGVYETVVYDSKAPTDIEALVSGGKPSQVSAYKEWEYSARDRRGELGVHPYRTYTLLVYQRVGENFILVAPPIRLGATRNGFNVCPPNALIGLGLGAAAALYVALLLRYRPGGRRAPSWLPQSRWALVILVSALGATMTGALDAFLPADLGGYDVLHWRHLRVCFLAAPAGAVVGLFLDWLRRQLKFARPAQAVGLVVLQTLITGLPLLLLQALSSEQADFERKLHAFSFSHVYYLYFGLAVTLPIVIVQTTVHRRAINQETGSFRTVRDRALVLLASSLASGLLAGIIAVTFAGLMEIESPAHAFRGFYKPAKAIAWLVVAVPVLASFAVAVMLAEERPQWVKNIDARIGRLLRLANDIERVREGRQIIAIMLGRVSDFGNFAEYLGGIAAAYPRYLRPFVAVHQDRKQLATMCGLPLGEVERLLTELSALLLFIEEGLTRRVTVPLPLVADGLRPVEGSVTLVATRDPALAPRERAYGVCRNRVPVSSGESLLKAVEDLCEAVLDRLAGEDADDEPSLRQHRLIVDFDIPKETNPVFRGASYQFPLALGLWQLARGATPLVDSWSATGPIGLSDWTVQGVEALDVKQDAIRNSVKLFLCPASQAPQKSFVIAHREDVGRVRRQIDQECRGRVPVIVGVQTFPLALEILFGERVDEG